jgi:hypothetical protein
MDEISVLEKDNINDLLNKGIIQAIKLLSEHNAVMFVFDKIQKGKSVCKKRN